MSAAIARHRLASLLVVLAELRAIIARTKPEGLDQDWYDGMQGVIDVATFATMLIACEVHALVGDLAQVAEANNAIATLWTEDQIVAMNDILVDCVQVIDVGNRPDLRVIKGGKA